MTKNRLHTFAYPCDSLTPVVHKYHTLKGTIPSNAKEAAAIGALLTGAFREEEEEEESEEYNAKSAEHNNLQSGLISYLQGGGQGSEAQVSALTALLARTVLVTSSSLSDVTKFSDIKSWGALVELAKIAKAKYSLDLPNDSPPNRMAQMRENLTSLQVSGTMLNGCARPKYLPRMTEAHIYTTHT